MTKDKALILAMIPFGVLMLIIGLLFGVGYWKAGDAAARYLALATGLGGSGYIFVMVYRTLHERHRRV
jgi:fumarate reductase subunit D